MAHQSESDVVEQFIFDYLVKTYLDELKDSNWMANEQITNKLKVLMTMPLDTDYPGNKFKAHLLIIVNTLISLKEMGLEESFQNLAQLEITDILQHLDHIQSSIENLWPENASSLKDISRECLFHIYSLFVSIITQDMSEARGMEKLKLLERVLKRMKSLTNFQSASEKEHFSLCERAVSEPGLCVDFPQPNKLWSLVRNVVLEASLLLETSSECVSRLKRKLCGETPQERRCKLSDLLEIVGQTSEEFLDERKKIPLIEKCEKIKRARLLNTNNSQKQVELSTERNAAQETVSPRKAAIAIDQDSSSESRSGCEETNWTYPQLYSVKPRLSLLNFGCKKPPSHLKIAGGKWLADEEEVFIVKTVEIGEGKWAEIKEATGSLRSNVQLKDKWRQIPSSRICKVARRYGLVYRGSRKK